MRKLEEEKRLTEEKNQENVRKLEEASKDLKESNYIPSGDSIHRPKLLFIPHPSLPEHELDSPVLGEEYIFDQPADGSNPTLTIPPPVDLLSPQYCDNPRATAKKIFSVTRVTSPTLVSPLSNISSAYSGFDFSKIATAVSSVINSPTQVHPPVGRDSELGNIPSLPQLCTPLETVTIQSLNNPIPISIPLPTTANSPNSLQKVIEAQTLGTYIQEIVKSNPEPTSSMRDDVCTDNAEAAVSSEPTNDNAQIPVPKDDYTECAKMANAETVDVSATLVSEKTATATVGSCDEDAVPLESKNSTEETDLQNCDDKVCDANKGSSDNTEKCDKHHSHLEDKTRVVESTVVDNLENGGGDVGANEKAEKPGSDENGEEQCDSNVEVSGEIKDDNTPSLSQHIDIVAEKEIEATESVGNMSSDAVKPDLNISNNNAESGVVSSQPSEILDSIEMAGKAGVHVVEQTNSIETVDNAVGIDGDINNVDLNGDFIDCMDSVEDYAVEETDKNSVDSEPWNSLNESDFPENDNDIRGILDNEKGGIPIAVNNNPDFHSNLSFNGLQQELASLIDEESQVGNGACKGRASPDHQQCNGNCL